MSNTMKSEAVDQIIPALLKAQGVLKHATKDSANPHFKSKYADLATVLDTAKPVLQANKLVVTHQRMSLDQGEFLVTTVWHESGQYLSSTSKLMPTKNDPQGFGSAMTYARRYDLSALIGLASDDDDGNSASGVANENKTTGKSIFKSSALRNEFSKNVVEALDKAADEAELAQLVSLYKPKMDEMEASGNEYDLMVLESLRGHYKLVRSRMRDEKDDEAAVLELRKLDEQFKDKVWQA